MKRRFFLLLALPLLLSGCIRQQPVLSTEPTPLPTPTPAPSPLAQEWKPESGEIDALSVPVYEDTHYLRYLTFQNLRVYEYAGGTLFDGVCANAYPETLAGAFELVFTDKDGTEIARAPVYTRSGGNLFPPGETVLYAEINTDMDIQLTPFELVVKQQIIPQATEPAHTSEQNT